MERLLAGLLVLATMGGFAPVAGASDILDFAVTSLEVEPLDPLGLGPDYDVTVIVENRGSLWGEGAVSLSVDAAHVYHSESAPALQGGAEIGGDRRIGGTRNLPGPGETVIYVYRWSAVGEMGDIVVRAGIVPGDDDHTNNDQSTTVRVLAGTPAVDLLQMQVAAGNNNDGRLWVSTDYHRAGDFASEVSFSRTGQDFSLDLHAKPYAREADVTFCFGASFVKTCLP